MYKRELALSMSHELRGNTRSLRDISQRETVCQNIELGGMKVVSMYDIIFILFYGNQHANANK